MVVTVFTPEQYMVFTFVIFVAILILIGIAFLISLLIRALKKNRVKK